MRTESSLTLDWRTRFSVRAEVSWSAWPMSARRSIVIALVVRLLGAWCVWGVGWSGGACVVGGNPRYLPISSILVTYLCLSLFSK